MLSVLFITYNRSDLLRMSIESLCPALSELGTDFEIIVADDCSDAFHQQVINTLPVTRVVSTERNSGLAANVNNGLQGCSGKYILQIQDDWKFVATADDLRAAIMILEENPQVGIVQLTHVMSDLPSINRKTSSAVPYMVFNNDMLPWNRRCGIRPYSDCPHLKTRDFINMLGPYKEKVSMGVAENDFKKRVARQEQLLVARLVKQPFFSHMGEQMSLNVGGKVHFFRKTLYKIPLFGPMFYSGIRSTWLIIDHWIAIIFHLLRIWRFN